MYPLCVKPLHLFLSHSTIPTHAEIYWQALADPPVTDIEELIPSTLLASDISTMRTDLMAASKNMIIHPKCSTRGRHLYVSRRWL
jgi:hypothetical protein